MSEPWTPGPWEWDGKFTVSMPMGDGAVYPFRVVGRADARLISLAPELFDALVEVTNWLEGSEAFATVHGAHTAAVEAQKLIARAKGEG